MNSQVAKKWTSAPSKETSKAMLANMAAQKYQKESAQASGKAPPGAPRALFAPLHLAEDPKS